MGLIFTGTVVDFRPLMQVEISGAAMDSREPVTALIDSGATDCVIRPGLVEKLGIPITDQVHTHNIGVKGIKPICRVDIRFINPDIDRWWLAKSARAVIDEFDPCADIIIGMNVLRLVTLTFRGGVPEIEPVGAVAVLTEPESNDVD